MNASTFNAERLKGISSAPEDLSISVRSTVKFTGQCKTIESLPVGAPE